MDAADQIAHDFIPYFLVYKDGHVKRLADTQVVPPSIDPLGVSSKDVEILPEFGVSARLYLPKVDNSRGKFPIVVYYHGGAFCFGSSFQSLHHSYLQSLAAEASVMVVSVGYRKAPEHPLPAAYDDSWAALQWVASHAAHGPGPDPWLREHGDLDRLYVAGDSAGGNIVHNMAMQAGKTGIGHGVRIHGAILVHPYFCWSDPAHETVTDPSKLSFDQRLWLFVCPSTTGFDDPRINPMAPLNPSLSGLGCSSVFVSIAEKDKLRDGGWIYYQALKSSGWNGVAEMFESEGEDHVFHTHNPASESARNLMKKIVKFLN